MPGPPRGAGETGADRVFGHSYGGFVALQTARRTAVFRQIAVYEPAVVLDGAPPPAWLDPYRELLAHGDTRGAFATMVKHAGFAPRALASMPLAVVRLVLRAGIRGLEWQRTEALLEANLAEQQRPARRARHRRLRGDRIADAADRRLRQPTVGHGTAGSAAAHHPHHDRHDRRRARPPRSRDTPRTGGELR